MVKKTLDDIRALVDPKGYLQAMEENKGNYRVRLGQLLVDYDLMADSPEIPEDARRDILERQLTLLRDVEWRMAAIEERIEAAQDGMAPGRGERRRKERKARKAKP